MFSDQIPWLGHFPSSSKFRFQILEELMMIGAWKEKKSHGRLGACILNGLNS